MMKTKNLKPIILAVMSALAVAQYANAEEVKTQKIEVIGITPLHSSGMPINDVPSNVQIGRGEDVEKQQSLSIADYMRDNMAGVNVNETQNNPFQPDVTFHGFNASPLLGAAQGLSVYQDGVRVNEPFGDTVNWDLIPKNAIAGINLMPGSNPLFGLNTLGGALSIQTKSGLTNPGGAAQVYGGSWGRFAGEAEYGGTASNGVNYFVSGNYFTENGWRDKSDTDVRQFFTKLGWQGEKTDFNVSLALADNDMNGNGYQSQQLVKSLGRDSVYTYPDNTKNEMAFLNGQFNHYFNDNLALNAVAYYRNTHTKTYNADINDDWAVDSGVVGSMEGAINRTKTRQDGYGATGQLNWTSGKNNMIVGAGYDRANIDFSQSAQVFDAFSANRGVGVMGNHDEEQSTKLTGTTKTWSVFATDTYKVTPKVALTGSARYNHTEVSNHDKLIPDQSDPESLTGKHTFNRLNPAIGMTFTPVPSLNFFAGYNEGSRAPSSIELGCANPNVPCKLPNAMAGDPPLKQVVAHTFEGGVRGQLGGLAKWSMAAYTTRNSNDIQFIAATQAGAGYFANVGQTRRTGVDLGFNMKTDSTRWMLGYSFVKATYESEFDINNAQEETLHVRKGDQIPGIPNHQLKLRGEFDILSNLQLGATALAYSSQYLHGNEDNRQEGGKVAGYAILNLDARYKFNKAGWQAFAKVNNVFDTDYYTGGMLGVNGFSNAGAFVATEVDDGARNDRFLAVGAPRAAWVGIRYEMPGSKTSAAADRD